MLSQQLLLYIILKEEFLVQNGIEQSFNSNIRASCFNKFTLK